MLSYLNVVVLGFCGLPLISQRAKISAFDGRELMFRLSWAHRVLENSQNCGKVPHSDQDVLSRYLLG